MRNYTETMTFQNEVIDLKKAGISKASLEEYTRIMSQFDENGCEVGTNYANVVLAYPHPIP